MNALSNPSPIAFSSGNILSVSPLPEDHTALEHIFQDFAGVARADTPWLLTRARTPDSALAALREVEYAVVMCEKDLQSGNWKDMLERVRRLSNPPLLIVTSRHADDFLWAEALNLGAHDVLAKPFYPSEVIRVINVACERWHRDREHTVPRKSVGMAAGGTAPRAYSKAAGLFCGQ